MNDYVINHDWGSYDCDKKVNKLLLRNDEDFVKYFNLLLQELFVAEISKDYKVTFINGDTHQVKIEKIEVDIN